MPGVGHDFFSFVASLIVERGKNGSRGVHTRGVGGIQAMLVQICRDYATLPPFETITVGQIRFFYEALRHELMGGDDG